MIKVFNGLKNLIKGMGITGKHLGRHAVTVQYPEERDNIPERSRGIVVLLSDKETGELNCTSCMLCMRVCPTAAIKIVAPRNPETKKRKLESFTVDHTICCFCGLCEQVCNFSAIKMATYYEFSTLDKKDLVWDVKKLQEMGRDVPYEKKERPGAAAKKRAAAKKAETKASGEKKEGKKDSGEKDTSEEKKAEPVDKDIESKSGEADLKNENKEIDSEDKSDNQDGKKE